MLASQLLPGGVISRVKVSRVKVSRVTVALRSEVVARHCCALLKWYSRCVPPLQNHERDGTANRAL